MMRLRTVLGVATLCSLAVSWVLWKGLLRDPPLTSRPIPPTPRERQLGFLLTPESSGVREQRLPTPLVLNTTLTRAVDDLREASGANIFVNWRMLAEVGVSRETLVSADVSGLPFADGLHVLLSRVSTRGAKLAFYIDGDEATSLDRGATRLVTHRRRAVSLRDHNVVVTTKDDAY